jgi:hypothetical protein
MLMSGAAEADTSKKRTREAWSSRAVGIRSDGLMMVVPLSDHIVVGGWGSAKPIAPRGDDPLLKGLLCRSVWQGRRICPPHRRQCNSPYRRRCWCSPQCPCASPTSPALGCSHSSVGWALPRRSSLASLINSARQHRARLTRLLTVPMAHPSTWAASS